MNASTCTNVEGVKIRVCSIKENTGCETVTASDNHAHLPLIANIETIGGSLETLGNPILEEVKDPVNAPKLGKTLVFVCTA